MAYALITKNFSNFSAWHYRAKLMPRLYNYNESEVNLGYIIPLDKIKEDMATLKHAFFTDPKDQSPWNYHQWLLVQISPVQVIHVENCKYDDMLKFDI
jgi:geranylgeranyl transferase type-2 subunit alpha